MLLTLKDLTAEQRAHVRKALRERPGWRILQGCERCGTPCYEEAKCACCRRFKTRTAGGTLSYFPDDGRGHYAIGSAGAA